MHTKIIEVKLQRVGNILPIEMVLIALLIASRVLVADWVKEYKSQKNLVTRKICKMSLSYTVIVRN